MFNTETLLEISISPKTGSRYLCPQALVEVRGLNPQPSVHCKPFGLCGSASFLILSVVNVRIKTIRVIFLILFELVCKNKEFKMRNIFSNCIFYFNSFGHQGDVFLKFHFEIFHCQTEFFQSVIVDSVSCLFRVIFQVISHFRFRLRGQGHSKIIIHLPHLS